MNDPNPQKLARALALTRQGLGAKARKLLHATLEDYPGYGPALDGLMEIASKAKNQGSPEMPTALIGEIVALYRSGNLESALGLTERVLANHPNAAVLYDIEGTVHVRLRDYPRAIESYENALRVNPAYAEVFNNMAGARQASGDLEGALDNLGTALRLRPDYGQAAANFLALCIQMDRPFEPFLGQVQELARTDLYLATYLAIQSFTDNDIVLTRTRLASLKVAISDETFKALNPARQLFVAAYTNFLDQLCAGERGSELIAARGIPQRKIFHVGESHCLSFAHQALVTGDASYVIEPRIVFGAKAWHFASPAASGYKSVLKERAGRIPEGADVLISFGEIDCRPDEGILQFHAKHGGDLEAATRRTALRYVRHVEECFRGTNTRRFYFEVPAPVRDESAIGSDPATHELRIGVIRNFNEFLRAEVAASRSHIVGIYDLTADDDGSSNLRYMCDGRHLGPHAWPEVSEMIRAQL